MSTKAIVTSASPDLFPVLETVSKPCNSKNKIEKVVNWLGEVMDDEDENAAGLSAVQIGEPQRIFLARVKGYQWRVFINPEIISRSRYSAKRVEGCLSLPGVAVMVKRPKHIQLKFKREFDGPEEIENFSYKDSRVISHEMDHLEGRLLTHIRDEQDLKAVNNAHQKLKDRKARAKKRRKRQNSR